MSFKCSDKQQLSVLKQLFNRECFDPPPGAQIHTVRNFYKAITPNTEVELQDDEGLEVCTFSACGKYLICSGKRGHSVEIFRGDSLGTNFLNSQNQNSSKFSDAFEHIGSYALDMGEIIYKDTQFFIEGTEILIICTHGQVYEEEDEDYQGLLFGTCAITSISMESPVRLLDVYRHHEDSFFNLDTQCVTLFNHKILLHSQRQNNLILLQISDEGNFEILKTIGINTPTPQQRQLLQQWYYDDDDEQQSFSSINVHQNLIAGFQQKLLTFLYLKGVNEGGEGWSLENFSQNFDKLQMIHIRSSHLLGEDRAIIVVCLGLDQSSALEQTGSICTVVYDLLKDTILCAFFEGEKLEQELAKEAAYLLCASEKNHSTWINCAVHNHVNNYQDQKQLRTDVEQQFCSSLQASPYLDRNLFVCSSDVTEWRWRYVQNDVFNEKIRFYSNFSSEKPIFSLGGYTHLTNIGEQELAEGVWMRRVFHPTLPMVLTLIFVNAQDPEGYGNERKMLAYHM